MASKEGQHQSLHCSNSFPQENYAVRFPVIVTENNSPPPNKTCNNFVPNGKAQSLQHDLPAHTASCLCLWGVAQLWCDLLQHEVSNRCACVKVSAKRVWYHFGGLTSLKRYRAIWGIAAIVSQYRTAWGHWAAGDATEIYPIFSSWNVPTFSRLVGRPLIKLYRKAGERKRINTVQSRGIVKTSGFTRGICNNWRSL